MPKNIDSYGYDFKSSPYDKSGKPLWSAETANAAWRSTVDGAKARKERSQGYKDFDEETRQLFMDGFGTATPGAIASTSDAPRTATPRAVASTSDIPRVLTLPNEDAGLGNMVLPDISDTQLRHSQTASTDPSITMDMIRQKRADAAHKAAAKKEVSDRYRDYEIERRLSDFGLGTIRERDKRKFEMGKARDEARDESRKATQTVKHYQELGKNYRMGDEYSGPDYLLKAQPSPQPSTLMSIFNGKTPTSTPLLTSDELEQSVAARNRVAKQKEKDEANAQQGYWRSGTTEEIYNPSSDWNISSSQKPNDKPVMNDGEAPLVVDSNNQPKGGDSETEDSWARTFLNKHPNVKSLFMDNDNNWSAGRITATTLGTALLAAGAYKAYKMWKEYKKKKEQEENS